MQPIKRKACRALLLTPQGEILLLKIINPSGSWVGWIAPGGGIEHGETEADTLRRELQEELGFRLIEGEQCVWRRTHEFFWGGNLLRQEEAFFLIRTEKFDPRPAEELIATEMLDVEFRWWPVLEIESSTEEFAPRRLGFFLQKLQDGLPPEPIDVGI